MPQCYLLTPRQESAIHRVCNFHSLPSSVNAIYSAITQYSVHSTIFFPHFILYILPSCYRFLFHIFLYYSIVPSISCQTALAYLTVYQCGPIPYPFTDSIMSVDDCSLGKCQTRNGDSSHRNNTLKVNEPLGSASNIPGNPAPFVTAAPYKTLLTGDRLRGGQVSDIT